MVYTVTLNPSIDYHICVDDLKEGRTNRGYKEEYKIGGKGINVSIILKNLGIESVCLGYVAGFTGNYIVDELNKLQINNDFINVSNGVNRVNVKINSLKETEVNGVGPEVDLSEINKFKYKLEQLNKDDIVVFSGSLPRGIETYVYNDFLKILVDKGVKFILDISDKIMLDLLKYKPFLIKPNESELIRYFDLPHDKTFTREELIHYGNNLNSLGAENVIISLGKYGALFINDNFIQFADGIKGDFVNSVGAGDSMIGGFLSEFLNSSKLDEAFKFSIASGTATAFSEGIANKEAIFTYKNKVNVRSV